MLKLIIAGLLVLMIASLVLTIGRWLVIGGLALVVLLYAGVISTSDIPAAPAWGTVARATHTITATVGEWVDRLSTRVDAAVRGHLRTAGR